MSKLFVFVIKVADDAPAPRFELSINSQAELSSAQLNPDGLVSRELLCEIEQSANPAQELIALAGFQAC